MSYLGTYDGNIHNKCKLGQKAKADALWLTNGIIKYMQIHRQRVDNREITGATLRNYLKSIKLFCEQLVITLPWKRITRGLSRGRRYANESSSIEGIRTIVV